MKTVINHENKKRFLLQYAGTPYKYKNEFGTYTNDILKEPYNFKTHVETAWLKLKPLSSITDEDAIEVANICLNPKEKPLQVLEVLNWDWCKRIIVNREPDPNNESTIIEMFISVGYEECEINFTWDYNHSRGTNVHERRCPNVSSAYDYLRSKGYALPWLNISVQDLVDCGWIKLKEI